MVYGLYLLSISLLSVCDDFDVSLLILGTGHGHPAEVDFCVDVLDRELGKISREMEEDQAFTTAHILRDAQFQFQLQPIFTGVANHVYSLQSLEPLRQGGASTPSINVVHYVSDPPHVGTTPSDSIK